MKKTRILFPLGGLIAVVGIAPVLMANAGSAFTNGLARPGTETTTVPAHVPNPATASHQLAAVKSLRQDIALLLVAVENEPHQKKPLVAESAEAQHPTYLRDVVPIVLGKCFRCHNQETTFLNNWLEYHQAFSERWEIKRRVWDSWKGHYFKQPMPTGNSPESDAISEEERAVLKEWVDTGAPYGVPPKETDPRSKGERMEVGRRVFTTICAACHQPTGLGLPNRFPPLAGSDFLNSDKQRAITVVIHGLQGEVTVNGLKFNNTMPLLPLSDGQIAAALTFVYNSFGNSGQDVTPEEVKAIRATGQVLNMPNGNGNARNRATEKSPWE